MQQTADPAAPGNHVQFSRGFPPPAYSSDRSRRKLSGLNYPCSMARPPLVFTFYIAAPIEKVWDGFVSKEINRTIFMGADFDVDLKPGGAMTWSGPGKDGKPTRYVTGTVVQAQPPARFEYRFGMGDGAVMSRVQIALTQESEAVKVVVTNDEFADDDPAYAQNADGWPRILSRLKTLLETGKTFKPH